MKESIYQKNKKRLEKYYEDLLKKLEQNDSYENNIDESHEVRYIDFHGKPILQIDKNNKTWQMTSHYKEDIPLGIWGKQYENIPFNSVIQFFGMASIPYIEKLLSITSKEVYIILYEPSIKVFQCIIEEMDLSFLESKRVGLIVKGLNDEQFLPLQQICVELNNLPHIKYVCHPNYTEIFGQEYKQYMDIIKDHMKRCMFNRNTQIIFNKEMPKNYVGNVRTFYHQHSVRQLCEALPKGMPTIIISAGPSLNKNIKDLKEARDKAFLIATDTALKPLLKENIVPHCFITVDPSKPMLLFEDERVFDIPMVLTDSGNSDVVKRHRGKKFFAHDGNGYIRHFYKKANIEPMGLSTGGSVANNAFSLGIEAGAKTIILVGQDLAFTGNKTHADGTFQEKMDEVDYTKRRMVEVESIDGGKVLTSLDFKYYLEWFENKVQEFSDVKVIDATEGGAKIQGTLIMPLKEAINTECKYGINLDKIIDKIPRLFSQKQIKEFDEYMKEAPIHLNNIYRKTERGIRYYEKLLPYFLKNDLSNQEFRKLYKNIKKIDRDLEKEPLMHVVKPYMKETEYALLYDIGMVKEDIEEEGRTISAKGIALFKTMQEAVEYVRPFIEEMANEKRSD